MTHQINFVVLRNPISNRSSLKQLLPVGVHCSPVEAVRASGGGVGVGESSWPLDNFAYEDRALYCAQPGLARECRRAKNKSLLRSRWPAYGGHSCREAQHHTVQAHLPWFLSLGAQGPVSAHTPPAIPVGTRRSGAALPLITLQMLLSRG